MKKRSILGKARKAEAEFLRAEARRIDAEVQAARAKRHAKANREGTKTEAKPK